MSAVSRQDGAEGRSVPSPLTRGVNRVRLFLSRPQRVAGWIVIIVLSYLIVFPLGEMIFRTLTVQEGDARRTGAAQGEWTAFYWDRMLTSPFAEAIFYKPLFNTLLISLSYTALAMALGLALAWLLVKTDMPFKSTVSTLAIVPYVLPSWTVAMAWIVAFGNHRVGIGAPGVIQSLTGLTPPDWLVYGPVPIVIVLALNYFAFAYLLAAAAFSSVDASLEEAAMIHGASHASRFRSVTLPLILPALGSAFILTFAQGLGSFGAPAILGFPERFYVLSTILFQSAQIGRFSDAYVLSLILIAISALTIYLNSLVLGRRRQFTTVTGKGVSTRLVKLGVWKVPITTTVLLFLVAAGIMPIVLLVWQSLQLRLGDYSLSNLTLTFWLGRIDGFNGILIDGRVHQAAWNTLMLGVSVGVLTAVIGVIIGYVLVKERGSRFAKVIEQLSFLPYLIPAIAFGLIYLTMFAQARGPVPALYGTFALLVLAAVVNRLPLATRTGVSAMMQLSPSLEEAAEVKGARVLTRLRTLILPLTRKGFLAGFILSFVSTVKDLSLVLLLITPQTIVLAPLAYSYLDLGRPQFAYAVSLIIILIVLVCTWAMRSISGADPFRGLGGSAR